MPKTVAPANPAVDKALRATKQAHRHAAKFLNTTGKHVNSNKARARSTGNTLRELDELGDATVSQKEDATSLADLSPSEIE